ncbi:MAG: protein kinase domain-containing protein [Pirellulaceae bacterium]
MTSSGSGSERNKVEVLAEELAERYRRGERPPLSEYAERYPEYAEQIRDLFPALLMMENLKPVSEDRVPDSSPHLTATTPMTIGEYRIIREVGRGGMGIVYEAEQVSLGRHVALKVLPKEMLTNGKHRRRFELEARAAARLHHTNIVPVFGVGEHHGQLYYVMQFIQGLALDVVLEDLRRLKVRPDSTSAVLQGREMCVSRPDVSAADLAQSLMTGGFGPLTEPARSDHQEQVQIHITLVPGSDASATSAPNCPLSTAVDTGRPGDTVSLSSSSAVLSGGNPRLGDKSTKRQTYWQSVAQIGIQVAEALDYAHAQGVMHRDIKPANLLLDMHGTVWVTDFGLAKLADGHGLTQTGDILGTLRYMAPETFKGQANARSELYSLGLTLYELLALRPAFDEARRETLIDRVMNAEVEPLGIVNVQIPRDLQTIVHKAIDRDPAHRYATARELAEDLQRFVEDEPIRARRISLYEYVLRWSRRNKGLAASILTVAVLLLVINISGPLFTWRLARLNSELRQSQGKLSKAVNDLTEARDAAEKQSTENLQLAHVADGARRASLTMLADMQTERGLLSADQGDAATATLWFASAAEQTPHDPWRTAENRLRARNWMREAVLPIALNTLSEVPFRFEFQPAGSLLLLGSRTGRFQVWDALQGRKRAWMEAVTGVVDACWSPDGGMIALGMSNGEIQMRSIESGEVMARLQCEGSVTALALSSTGDRLAVGGNTVRVWKLRPDAVLEQNWPHPQPVQLLAFDPTGRRLVTVTQSGEAQVYDVAGTSSRSVPLFGPIPHRPRQASLPAFVDGGKGLITVTRSVPPELAWTDTATGQPTRLGTFTSEANHIERVVASANGKWFAAGGYSEFEIWDVSHPEANSQVVVQGNQVLDIAFAGDGSEIMTASQDQTVRRWSLPGLTRTGSVLPHMGSVTRCAFSPQGELIATLQGDGMLRMWKCPAKDLSGTIQGALISKTFLGGKRARLSLDGKWITPGLWHAEPGGFPVQSRADVMVIKTQVGRPTSAKINLPGVLIDSCVAADNGTLAAISTNAVGGWLSLHELTTGRSLKAPLAMPSPPLSIAPRPGRPEIAVLCAAGELLVCDVHDGTQRLQLDHRDGWSGQNSWARVVYSPDGATLLVVTPGSMTAVVVRDADTGLPRFSPIRPVLSGGPCRCIAVSADSRRLATAVNGRNAVQVWDLVSGEPLSAPLQHPGDTWGLYSVAFTPDGQFLLSGCRDGQARLWNWQTGKLVCPPMKHSDDIFDAAITDDGKHALTACRDGLLRIWELTTGKLVASPIRLAAGMGRGALSGVLVHGDRAIVSVAETGECSIINLATLLNEPSTPSDVMRSFAELASCQRIEGGDLNRLTADDWRTEWSVLSSRFRYFDSCRERLIQELDAAVGPAERQLALDIAEPSLDSLTELARLRPEIPQLQSALACELKRAGRSDAAAQHFAQAVVLHERRLAECPTDAETAEQLAYLLLEIVSPRWHPLKSLESASAAGATLTTLDDGSVLASGTDAVGDVYTIKGFCEDETVGAVRLEVLPDPSLPNQGPGRDQSGNFHLSEIELLVPAHDGKSDPQARCFSDAWASFDYRAFDADIAGTIDRLNAKVWHVWGRVGMAHEAVFAVAVPVHVPPNQPLVIQLKNTPLNPLNLGRFRVSTCSQQDIARWRLQHKLAESGLSPFAALGLAFAANGEESRAVTMLGKTLDHACDLKGGDGLAEELVQYPKLLGQLVEHRPFDPCLHLALARTYERQGARDKGKSFRLRALAACQTLLAKEPGNSDLAAMFGQIAAELNWTWLDPIEVKSVGGATMTVLEDQSILVTGENPDVDTYTVRVKGDLNQLTALRLEVLPDGRLPGPGPGRTTHGNFTLTEVRVSVATMHNADPPKAVRLCTGSASYIRPTNPDESNHDGPGAVLDGAHDSAWDVWPNVGLPNSLWLEFAEPLTVEADSFLVVELDFNHPRWKNNGLGRFRLSATDAERPLQTSVLAQALISGYLTGDIAVGAMLYLGGNLDEARAQFTRVGDAPGSNPLALLLLAFAQQKLNQAVQAEELGRFWELCQEVIACWGSTKIWNETEADTVLNAIE